MDFERRRVKHLLYFISLIILGSNCGEKPKSPAIELPTSTINSPINPSTYLINVFGDSLKWNVVAKSECFFFVKWAGEAVWEPFVPILDSLHDHSTEYFDVRCIDFPNSLQRKDWEIVLHFLFHERATPPNWLEKVIAFDGKKVPEALWKAFFAKPYGEVIPVIHILRCNLDDDPKAEILIWYNRPPKNIETCLNMAEFFDCRDGHWQLIQSVGPSFLPINVRYNPGKKAVSIRQVNPTSDGIRKWEGFYSMTGGYFHLVD